jgi:hypothetical protein
MIAFDLKCGNEHTFEGWFEDGKAFESQLKKGLVTCPLCDDGAVMRMPSSFGIKKATPAQRATADERTALAQLGNNIFEFVEKNFDNVGTDFAKEALKIHYGAAEPRNIRGVSTQEEERVLKEEGITVMKIPVPSSETDFDA